MLPNNEIKDWPWIEKNFYPENPTDYGFYIHEVLSDDKKEIKPCVVSTTSLLNATKLIYEKKWIPIEFAINLLCTNFLKKESINYIDENDNSIERCIYAIDTRKFQQYLEKPGSWQIELSETPIETVRITIDWKWLTILMTKELKNAIRIMMEVNYWMSSEDALNILIKNYLIGGINNEYRVDIYRIRKDLGLDNKEPEKIDNSRYWSFKKAIAIIMNSKENITEDGAKKLLINNYFVKKTVKYKINWKKKNINILVIDFEKLEKDYPNNSKHNKSWRKSLYIH